MWNIGILAWGNPIAHINVVRVWEVNTSLNYKVMYAQFLGVVTKSNLCHFQYLSGFQMVRDTLNYVKEKIA